MAFLTSIMSALETMSNEKSWAMLLGVLMEISNLKSGRLQVGGSDQEDIVGVEIKLLRGELLSLLVAYGSNELLPHPPHRDLVDFLCHGGHSVRVDTNRNLFGVVDRLDRA